MSQDTETQSKTTNSYTSILRSSGSLKSGCAKCDGKNLPVCCCSKGDSINNESEEKSSALTEVSKGNNLLQQTSHYPTPHHKSSMELTNKESTILVLSGPQQEHQVTLKFNVKFIKALLEQFIKRLAHFDGIDVSRNDLSIKELGNNFGIYYDDTQQNTLAITFKNSEHCNEFFNLLGDEKINVMKQEHTSAMENIIPEVNNQSFTPNPFTTSLTPVKGF